MNRRNFLKLLTIAGIMPEIVFARSKKQIPVLMFHDINEDPKDHYSVTPDKFASLMHLCKEYGYNPIPIHQIDKANKNNFVITFDDGYYSYISHAMPILKKLNWPATINIVGSWVGNVIPDIKMRPALDWADIKYLLSTNLVTIGCHTFNMHHLNHHNVTHSTRMDIKQDLQSFIAQMYIMTKTRTNIIAWPYGFFNDVTISVAESMGFKYFLTSQNKFYTGNHYNIPRFSINNKTDLSKIFK